MRLVLSETKKSRKTGIKAQTFEYSEKFLNSLQKPGKTTFIRFSDEMPGGGLVLAPNISKQSQGQVQGHTPAAIYGYPLDDPKIRELLLGQKLEFSNLPIIIVYWVDNEGIVDLGSIRADQAKDLIKQIISITGQEKVLESLRKWSKKNERLLLPTSLPERIIASINNIDALKLSDEDAPNAFWRIISGYGQSATDKTLLLRKLKIKQTDREGKTVETGFSNVIDKKGIIDPKPIVGSTTSLIQGFSLSTANIDDYKFYENPVAYKERKGVAVSPQTLERNKKLFNDFKDNFLNQRGDIKDVIDNEVKFIETSNGLQIDLNLPIDDQNKNLANALIKKYKLDSKKFKDEISYRISGILNDINGQAGYSVRIPFEHDISHSKGISDDYHKYTFSIKLPNDSLVSNRMVYSFIYFLNLVFTKKLDIATNPFIWPESYEEFLKEIVEFTK